MGGIMDQDAKHLETVKQKVEWIYNQSQDAIDSNDVLAKLYEEHFGDISESVYRAGRFWRSDKAKEKRFIRTPEKAERDVSLMDLNRDYWGKGVSHE